MTHDLKTWPEYFQPIAEGRKTFEIRYNDRDFQVGDTLHLREWSAAKGYSGNEAWAEVTYATDFLQSDRVVVMSFCVKRVKNGVIDLIIGSFNPAPAPEKETTP